jgi:hypothetical protein
VGGKCQYKRIDIVKPITVDAVFRPPAQVREAAARVAARAKVKADWLNDAVKGFVSSRGDFAPFLELEHLRIMTAQPEYLLAMKCPALRIGAEFHDEDDVRYLLRLLEIRTYDDAMAVSPSTTRSSVFPRRLSTPSPSYCRNPPEARSPTAPLYKPSAWSDVVYSAE